MAVQDGKRSQAQEKTTNIKKGSRNTQTNSVNDGLRGLGRLATITVKKHFAEVKPILEDHITF